MARQRTLGGEPDRRVLIIGGFGGVYTALGLERQLRPEDRTEVTLVNNDNFFLYTPLLTFVVAGGGFTGVEVAGEINDLMRQVLPSYPTISQREVRVRVRRTT